jgi:hypothetical protein
MATTQSGVTPFPTASPNTRELPGVLVTTVTPRRPVQTEPAKRPAAVALPREPEDARLTGGTRSLDRRLLALNLGGSRPGGSVA